MAQQPESLLARALSVLRAIEWSAEDDHEDGGTEAACPCCGEAKRIGHAESCSLASVLFEAGRQDSAKASAVATGEW